MKLLIRVVRNAFQPEVNIVTDHRLRRFPSAIMTREMNVERTDFTHEGEFFLCNEEDLDPTVRALAEANPGREVQVYNLMQSAQCPAGEMVMKKVTKDGVLPEVKTSATFRV